MTTSPDSEDTGTAEVPAEADRLARRLIDDVAAYEVDPPAPARVTERDRADG